MQIRERPEKLAGEMCAAFDMTRPAKRASSFIHLLHCPTFHIPLFHKKKRSSPQKHPPEPNRTEPPPTNFSLFERNQYARAIFVSGTHLSGFSFIRQSNLFLFFPPFSPGAGERVCPHLYSAFDLILYIVFVLNYNFQLTYVPWFNLIVRIQNRDTHIIFFFFLFFFLAF